MRFHICTFYENHKNLEKEIVKELEENGITYKLEKDKMTYNREFIPRKNLTVNNVEDNVKALKILRKYREKWLEISLSI